MKKFYLLLALVLMVGVVHAQGYNFGERANLTYAEKLYANFPNSTNVVDKDINGNNITGTVDGVGVTYFHGWDKEQNKLYWSHNEYELDIFTASDLSNKLNGKNLMDVFENFVIRTKDTSTWQHYYGRSSSGDVTSNSSDNTAITYAVCFYNGTNLLSKMEFWSGDVKIAPLRALCKTDKKTELTINEINSINRVTIKSNSPNGQVYFEEAYFISAYKNIDYTDRQGIDIGNAYIDPSYLIRSNHLWLEINDGTNGKPNDRSFEMVADGSNKVGTLSFSLPYMEGIDMTDVTFTALDFDRKADVLSRCIYENRRLDLHRNPTVGSSEYADWRAKTKDVLVRDLYNSRYNGPFYDQNGGNALDLTTRGDVYLTDKAIKHVNSIYWQSVTGTTERRIKCQNMSLTKNTIKARTTRKALEPTMWPQPDVAGFRSRLTYPIQPYYENEGNWSDVVRGDWNDGTSPAEGAPHLERTRNCADFSRYNKMRITGSPNTSFDIRFSTKATVEDISSPDDLQVIVVKTDAHGEVNVDLDIYDNFLLHAILFHNDRDNELGLYNLRTQLGRGATETTPAVAGLRDNLWVNNVELFEGEGRLVDLIGSPNQDNSENMFHVYNVDNNYQWQYGTIVRWAANMGGQSVFVENTNVNSGDVIWGTMGLYPQNYADLTGYKAIRVYSNTSGGRLRFIFNTKENSTIQVREDKTVTINKQDNIHHYYPELEGLYYAELDISNYDYCHLNGIKALSSFEVKAIKLVEDEEADYVCYGNGSCYEQNRAAIDPSVQKAVNDATAKVIDMRARCNNMEVPFDEDMFGDVQQTQLPKTANPNVLYIQRENQFEGRKVGEHEEQKKENEKPVFDNEGNPVMITVEDYKKVNFIVPSGKDYNVDGSSEYFTSNDIDLKDGYSFYAPKKIKADVAKYTRTFNNANVVNSVILPFAVDAGNDTEKKSAGFYKTDVTLESTATEGKVGILEEQDVKKGDWLLQFTKKTGTTEPNTPYLYAVTTGTGEHVFNGVATEDGKVVVAETPDVHVPAHLNMTNNLPNATDPTYAFYLRGVYEGTYLEHILFYAADGTLYRTPYMTVTPFRTIIKSPIDVTDETWETDEDNYFKPSGNVKVVLAFDGDDSSLDINSLVSDGLFAEDEPIYNLAGQRVNTFDKGVYIVGGKKILVK